MLISTSSILIAARTRDMQGGQAILRGREWSGPVAPYVSLVRERLWERQLVIISTGFTSLPLERVASMLSCSVDEAEKGAHFYNTLHLTA